MGLMGYLVSTRSSHPRSSHPPPCTDSINAQALVPSRQLLRSNSARILECAVLVVISDVEVGLKYISLRLVGVVSFNLSCVFFVQHVVCKLEIAVRTRFLHYHHQSSGTTQVSRSYGRWPIQKPQHYQVKLSTRYKLNSAHIKSRTREFIKYEQICLSTTALALLAATLRHPA
jgi:hypothetical protein